MNRLIAALVLTAACGAPRWSGDPELYGIDIVIQAGGSSWSQQPAAWTQDPALKARLKLVIAETAAFYGHDTAELNGLRIVLTGGAISCSGENAAGCMNYGDNTATLNTRYNTNFPCVEFTKLSHELLHYFLGESSGNHVGKEWNDLPTLEFSLENESQTIPGYCVPVP